MEHGLPLPTEPLAALVDELHRVGERLVAALAEEERLSSLARSSNDPNLLAEWKRARWAVDQHVAKYCDLVVFGDFPANDPVRELLEMA